MNEELGWAFVDVAEVIQLHRLGIEEHGGQPSTEPRTGCVEGSIGNAIQAAMYAADDDEPDLIMAASYLLVYLAKNHCFTDGNKRAAWGAVVRTFDLNDIRIVANQKGAARLVDGVAEGRLDVHAVLSWFAEPGRLVAAPEMAQGTLG